MPFKMNKGEEIMIRYVKWQLQTCIVLRSMDKVYEVSFYLNDRGYQQEYRSPFKKVTANF